VERSATNRRPSATSPSDRSIARPRPSPQAAVLSLQRAIGNRATGRVLARQPAATTPAFREWTLLYKNKFGSYEDDDGFIYPTDNDQIVLTPALVPNLTSIREQADERAQDLAALRRLGEITGQFINIVGMYSGVLGELHGISGSSHEESARSMRVESEGELEPSTEGATPREEPSTTETGPGGEPGHEETPMALAPVEPAPSKPKGKAPAREPAGRAPGGHRAEPRDEMSKKPPRKKSARQFNHKDPDSGERSGGSGVKRGSLEGRRNFPVYRADGTQITDIDHFENDILWEEKSAINAPVPEQWVAEQITPKFDQYIEARARLPAEYKQAPIGFRFEEPVKLELSTAVYDEISRLQELHPDVEILLEFPPGTGR
jgi:hypothetical protein